MLLSLFIKVYIYDLNINKMMQKDNLNKKNLDCPTSRDNRESLSGIEESAFCQTAL